MLEFIKNKLFLICIGLLVISIAGNVALLIGKGITINNKTENNLDQRQFQTQAQLNIFGNIVQGKKAAYKGESFQTFQELISKLNEIGPFISWPSWSYNYKTESYDLTYVVFEEDRK